MQERELVFDGILAPLREIVASLDMLPTDPDALALKKILDRARSEVQCLKETGASPRRYLEVIK